MQGVAIFTNVPAFLGLNNSTVNGCFGVYFQRFEQDHHDRLQGVVAHVFLHGRS